MSVNPYFEFLDKLEKPARYIGGELYHVEKEWSKCIGRAALCFPDLYEVGMSHLGMKILYDEVNRQPDLLLERCFAPWLDAEKEIRARNLNLVTLESFTPLKDFDLVGFSLQYEMTYTNILTMLNLGGITLRSNERGDDEPIISCGGPCACEPEPLAPFIDLYTIGDGEELFANVIRKTGELKRRGASRIEILKEFIGWDGVYIPAFYTTCTCSVSGLQYVKPKQELPNVPAKVRRNILPSIRPYNYPTQVPIPHATAVFDRFAVELARGCTEGCRFCQAGIIYRPIRERAPQEIIKTIIEGLAKCGFEETSLTCLSTADYSAVTPLILQLLDIVASQRAELGISSLRAYGLDPKILDKLATVKNTSLTFAPEAGSERLRRVINKNVTADDLLQTTRNIFSRGWTKMKLYFMIGLPTESDEDVLDIINLASTVKDTAKATGAKAPEITVSVSSFVPKPFTAFQWAGMISLNEINRKQGLLFSASRKAKVGFRHHFSKISVLEGLFARGDRRLADLLELAWRKGARFDGWKSTFNFKIWQESIEELNIDTNLYTREIPTDAHLPWEHIDIGVTRDFLIKEWQRAQTAVQTPPCGKPLGEKVHFNNVQELEADKRPLVCHNCGLKCNLSKLKASRKEFLTSLGAFTPESYQEIISKKQDIPAPFLRGQIEGVLYRICYAKIGALSFISHLDLQKVMARIFRRSGIEIMYSAGFTKHPIIAMGPALPLGISSLCEFVDIMVPYPWQNRDEVLQTIQSASEPGLIFRSAQQISRKEPSLQNSMREFHYFIPTQDDLSASITKILQAKELLIAVEGREKKRIARDVRPLIKNLYPGYLNTSNEALKLLKQVNPHADTSGLYLEAFVDNGGSIRPSEIIALLNQYGVTADKPIKVYCKLEAVSNEDLTALSPQIANG